MYTTHCTFFRLGRQCSRTTWPGHHSKNFSTFTPRFSQPFNLFQRFRSRKNSDKSFADELRTPSVLKPFLFAVGCSGLTYVAAAHLTNDDTERWTKSLLSTGGWIFTKPSNSELRGARKAALYTYLKTRLDKIKHFFGEERGIVASTALYGCILGAQKWLDEGEGRRIARMIMVATTGVWVLWQIPRLRGAMMRHFLHDPLSGQSHTLLTSVFSHKSLLHLVFNNFALSGFGSLVCWWFTEVQDRRQATLHESTPMYHFFAFFVSAGLFSSFVAHAVRVKLYYPRLVSQIAGAERAAAVAGGSPGVVTSATAAALAQQPSILPSLGASGAIWACISMTALACPDARATLVFPSNISFPLPAGALAMVGIDILGILRGWRFFDHWAHLAGALFGALYFQYGPSVWEKTRERVKNRVGESRESRDSSSSHR